MLVTVRGLIRLLCIEFSEAFIQLTLKLITTLTLVICGKDKQIQPASGRQSTEEFSLAGDDVDCTGYVGNSNMFLCSDMQRKNTVK